MSLSVSHPHAPLLRPRAPRTRPTPCRGGPRKASGLERNKKPDSELLALVPDAPARATSPNPQPQNLLFQHNTHPTCDHPNFQTPGPPAHLPVFYLPSSTPPSFRPHPHIRKSSAAPPESLPNNPTKRRTTPRERLFDMLSSHRRTSSGHRNAFALLFAALAAGLLATTPRADAAAPAHGTRKPGPRQTCHPSPCKHGAKCSFRRGVVTCKCATGYTGTYCATLLPGFYMPRRGAKPRPCPQGGSYCIGGAMEPCPEGSATEAPRGTSLSACMLKPGFFCVFGTDGVCTPTLCAPGHVCGGHVSVTDTNITTEVVDCPTTDCEALGCTAVSPPGSSDASSCKCVCDCYLSEWKDTSECLSTTGTKTQERTVATEPRNGGTACSAELTRTVPCDVNCVLSDWTDTSSCSSATGTKTQARTVVTAARNDGAACSTELTRTAPCDVDCVLSDWTDTSSCFSATGTKTQARTVVTAAHNDGKACSDELTRTTTCAVDCVLSDWRDTSECSMDGNKTQERSVATRPLNEGAPCGPLTQTTTCDAPTCTDGVKNGGESDVDCGGTSSCALCATGSACSLATDCVSGVCTAGACIAASCTDGVKNGAESAIDCGGGVCTACGVGKSCLSHIDCVLTAFCDGSTMVCAAKKAVGAGCADAVECTTGRCASGTCSFVLGSINTIATPIGEVRGLAFDNAGRLLFTEMGTNVIRRMLTNGTPTIIAGRSGVTGYSGNGGQATDALLYNPTGIAVDSDGAIFFADSNNQVIRKIDTNGVISLFAGVPGAPGYIDGHVSTARFYYPMQLAFDSSGALLVADHVTQRIRKIKDGVVTTIAGSIYGYNGDSMPATLAYFRYPYGVAFNTGDGSVVVADTDNHRIRKIDATSGYITTIAGTGSPGYSGDGLPADQANVYGPMSVAVDNSGRVLIADTGNARIRRIESDGKISTIAGTTTGFSGDGGPATAAKLYSPRAVALDREGNVFIADSLNYRIRQVTFA
jgi:sugar lactone lactonase YvrE